MTDYQGVLVHCEITEGRLASIALELLGIGDRLAQDLGEKLCAALTGSDVDALAQEAIAYGADTAYVVDDPLLQDYLTEPYLTAMEKVVDQAKPQVLLFGQTSLGRDLAPRLAFRLDTAASLDCVALDIDPTSRRLLQTKPVYGGNAQAVFVCDSYPQIATVRSKAVSPAVEDAARKGEVVAVAADIDPSAVRARLIETRTEVDTGIKLEEASVIVTGGRGIGGTEGFEQLQELAMLLKGAVGASRPPCDNEWVHDGLQIGLTGKTVSPDLYIAVAVSGSSQHLSGCSGSKTIVAINKDPQANIFTAAHYGVCGDWKKVLPAFTSKVRSLIVD